MMTPAPFATALALSLIALSPALADDPATTTRPTERPHHVYLVGSLLVTQPWIDVAAGGDVSAGYLTVRNRSGAPDRLTGASLNGAGAVTVVASNDGAPAANGLVVPPNGTLVLKPGDAHLALKGLQGVTETSPPLEGTLHFERAGSLHVSFPASHAEAMQDDQTEPLSDDKPVKLSQ